MEQLFEFPELQRLLVPLLQLKSLLVKPSLLGSNSGVPRQNPKSKVLLVKLGLLGPEQTTRLAVSVQQLQKLLVKLGLLGSPSTVSRQR